MDVFSAYLLTVTGSAIFCGVIQSFFKKDSSCYPVIRLLAGIFMAITVMSPFLHLKLQNFTDYVDDFYNEGQRAAFEGRNNAQKDMEQIIIEKSEAYILDKAAKMGAHLSVDIRLDQSDPPIPQSVIIKGAVSPTVKSELEEYIRIQLGIDKENQIWNQYPQKK